MENKRKKVGLALGSGGGRGFCHLGVISVLQENNIPIDYVSGASMGAIVGACFCAGVPIEELIKTSQTRIASSIVDIQISLKRRGLLKGEKVVRILKKFIKDKNFEDCKIPFYCTVTNLSKGKQIVFDSGPMINAVRASISIPVAFQAIQDENNDFLVDGGVLERIPINVLKDKTDIIIAVDALGPPSEDFKPKSFFDVIERTYFLMDWESSKEKMKQADLTLMPVQNERHVYTFKNNIESIEAGRKCALENLDKIKELIN